MSTVGTSSTAEEHTNRATVRRARESGAASDSGR